ncbi:transglycosylase SLT domain-containing protein [Streptomyces sp. URMC 123]|uniref:aggregation-promoting factor C-terminal-like domain-containing protein n=1 Tax=Streptomyces sp. URMC 123 TaxID=3423403 RepID=UPI003F1E3A9A
MFSTFSRIASRKNAAAAAIVAVGASGLFFAAAPAQAADNGAKDTARKIITDGAQFQCFSNIVERESGWNPQATNAASGAYGLVQALPGSKMASAGADWKTNAETQIKWGLDYMKDRYGSPCGAWNFWQANHWY